MTSIRAQLETHVPILARRTSQPGVVAVEHADIAELTDITLTKLDVLQQNATHVFVSAAQFQELVQNAHDIIHSEERGAERLFDAVFGTDEGDGSEDRREADETEGISDDEGENRRNISMHYAVAIVTTEINAAHGLEGSRTDIVELARKIDTFLKNG